MLWKKRFSLHSKRAVIKQKGRKEVFPGKEIFCFNKKADIDRDRMCPLQKLGK